MKKDNKAIVMTSIIAGVVLVVALVALFTANSSVSGKNVTVQGVATIDATPDLITVYYNIQGKGDTSSEAKDAADEIYDNLVVALAIEGFSKDELKTQGFNIYPNYEYSPSSGKQTQKGYIATHSLKLELSSDEFDKVSGAIDAGVDANASINYINFELSQELQSEKKAEALELASKDAKVKAEAVAQGFNKKVGRLVSVQVSDFDYYPWNIYTARSEGAGYDIEDAALAKESVANINPSEQQINAQVTATYKLN